jgi:hypothetical protein
VSSTHSFKVRIFDCNIHLVTECREVHTILERYVFPSLPRTDVTTNEPDIFVHVDRVAEQLQLSVNDVLVASACHAMNLVPALIRALDEAVIQRLTSPYIVHAGTVTFDGRALLVPGVTHVGKSTLIAELLRRGATYFSDEYALIDAEGRVHPYPRALLLRNGSGEQYPVLPRECNASVGEAPVPVGWILSLEYRPLDGWRVTAVSQGEGLFTLLRNTPHLLAESPHLLETFRCAVAGATCYAGSRTDAVHAADQILRLIRS